MRNSYYPSEEEFLKLTKKGNVIPVYGQINADLDTPVSAFLKIKKGEYSFLLESVEGQENIAKFSFLGANPSLVIRSKARNIEIRDFSRKSVRRFITKSDPLQEIKKIMQRFKAVPIKGLPRFYGGLVGFAGYDLIRFFEDIPDKNRDDLRLPDSVFMLTDTILVFDHINHTIKIVTNVILPEPKKAALSQKSKRRLYRQALGKIKDIQAQLKGEITLVKEKKGSKSNKIRINSNFKRSEFQEIIKKAKVFIRKGDIIQTVLSQRFSAKITGEPFDIYRALRSLNPSPYMYFLKFKGFYLVGSSPEMLVRCEEGVVRTRPIAGTRPRGRNQAEDLRLEKELLHDSKERAEHIMLVDLGRNDLGRVCKPGTVKLSEFMNVEKYSHVMHLVTEVRGRLQDNLDVYEVLRAGFPAGTVSGSPKIRAMEIIDELENLRRGPYAGCVGYFSFSHNMDTCITIRTIVIKGGVAYIQAGAGIVADSLPNKEYLETVNKAKALFEAIRQVTPHPNK